MKSINLIRLYLMILLLCVASFAHSRGVSHSFVIQEGVVTITPAQCPPCTPISARLTGSFRAQILDDSISFSNIKVSSIPESEFTLPEAPNEDGNTATFSFDGTRLVVSGVVDSRAFDGPLQEYEFTAQVSENQGFDAKGYYTARRDLRRCMSPLCGGIFVKSVNTRLTKCADGSSQQECYVGLVDWTNLGFDPFNIDTHDGYSSAPILLKGKLVPSTDTRFGNVGEFIATEAYRPATDNLAEGTFSALKNNGVVCITTPCFSIDEFVLNKEDTYMISDLDLNPVGASNEDVAIAYSQLSSNSALIVAGYDKKGQELHKIGITFIANQFYLPIQPPGKK